MDIWSSLACMHILKQFIQRRSSLEKKELQQTWGVDPTSQYVREWRNSRVYRNVHRSACALEWGQGKHNNSTTQRDSKKCTCFYTYYQHYNDTMMSSWRRNIMTIHNSVHTVALQSHLYEFTWIVQFSFPTVSEWHDWLLHTPLPFFWEIHITMPVKEPVIGLFKWIHRGGFAAPLCGHYCVLSLYCAAMMTSLCHCSVGNMYKSMCIFYCLSVLWSCCVYPGLIRVHKLTCGHSGILGYSFTFGVRSGISLRQATTQDRWVKISLMYVH